MAKSSVLTYSDSYETIKGCKKWLPIQNYEDNRRGKNLSVKKSQMEKEEGQNKNHV